MIPEKDQNKELGWIEIKKFEEKNLYPLIKT
jgi:hypothetical protein